MKLGYIKVKSRESLEKDENTQVKLKKQLGVDKIFYDTTGETWGLADAVEYMRFGDVLLVDDVNVISEDVGEFIRWCIKFHSLGITLICKHHGIDTSSLEWHFVLECLTRNKTFQAQIAERQTACDGKTRFYEELDHYFICVSKGELTAKEVCERMKIGKSTYYRRWRTHGPHVKRENDDRNDSDES